MLASAVFLLAMMSAVASAQVTVTATAGTVGPTPYTTLKGAFDAINAGSHQGAITIDINGNTTETATAALNASGSGAAVYTSVSISPSGAPRTITGSIVGAIIKLNGADNVTIDGRIGGVGRNLTVSNTNTSSATAAIWLASVAAGNGASNNTIRNLEIAAGTDSSSSSSSVSFGIIMCGITIGVTVNGDDNDNNSFIENRIIKARYGIVTRGTTTNLNINPVVTDNIVGPSAFGTDQIGKIGIFMQADTGATVSRNTVQFVGCLDPQACAGADRMGIAIGNESWSMTPGTITSNTYTVTKNVIHDIVEETTFSAVGIDLATTGGGVATNNVVANNFIYNVRANGTFGDQAVGIGIAGGHTDRVVFNSIAMTGDVDPGVAAACTNFGSGIRVANVSSASHANLLLVNNSIYLDLSSSSTATVRFYAISGNAAAYSFGTGSENFNNYFINPANPQLQTGGLGTTSGNTLTTQFATLANWQTAYTVAQDANSIQSDPLYFSTTNDLHISGSSPNVDFAVTVASISDDIDSQARPNGVNPDIGADEFYPSPGTLQFSSATYNTTETAGTATITLTRTGGNNGAVQVDYATVAGGSATGGAACTAGVDYISTSGTLMWADLDAAPKSFNVTICSDGILESGETVNLALSNAMVASLGTPNTAVLSISDAGTVFNGSVNVGASETITSLTNPGGMFEAINNGTVTGNTTINVTSDLSGESGTIALNEFAGGFTLTIKPSGGARTVSGSSTVGIIRLNDADNIVIDGSLIGGTATGVGGDATLRNLTVQNTNPAATAGGVIIVTQGTNGAQNVTIKNVNVLGQDPTQTLIGIDIGGNTPGTSPTANNNNGRVENCSVQKAFVGVFYNGVTGNSGTGAVITRNDLSGTGANRLRRVGIFFFSQNGIQVTENKIGGISTDENVADAVGIVAGIQNVTTTNVTAGGVFNAVIAGNQINGITSTSTVGFSAVGIAIAGDPAGPNTISNNMISGVTAPSTSPDIVAGIFLAGVTGSNTKVYHNSISNTGARGAVASQIGSYGIAISGIDPTVELKNNIFYNTQTSGGGANAKSYAIGMQTTTFANLDSNFNDFFTSGANAAGFRTASLDTAGTDDATLAAWQARVSDDANSLGVDPLYINPASDLHLQPTSPPVSAGTPIASVTVDFDNDPRPAANPDIGADELVQAVGGVIPAGTFYNASAVGGDSLGGNVTITNTLYLAGPLSTGANTLTIGCNASVIGAGPGSYVIGNLARDFCAIGSKVFDVGTANGYSPVTANVTAGTFPSTLTVTAIQGPQPSVNPATSIQRYWQLTESGDITADLTFQYLGTDVMGNEANYKVIRVIGGTPVAFPTSTVNTIAHTASLAGVSSFSDWTVGEVSAPTAAPATISGQVTTESGAPMPGVIMNLSGARSARTITDAQGNYRFANVDTDRFYNVTPSIVNYHFSPTVRSFSLLGNRTDATFTGTLNSVITGNVIDTPEYFVRQHYLDFLGREPDDAGLNFWSDQILGCGNDFNCIERRTINVSAAYFLSIEFQETGGLVDGLYRASYDRAPLFGEFMPDTARVARDVIVGEPGWQTRLATNKQEFLDAWVQRADFRAAYDNLDNGSYVDRLISHTGVSFTNEERATLVGGLGDGTLTRAQVLQRVAENERFVRAKFNEAFVRMQYFGYLRRDPDDSGFHFWLHKLNEFNGNFEQAEMVRAFIVSSEYRNRFRQ
jgi:hypothetical protein